MDVKQTANATLLPTHVSGKQHLAQPRGQHSLGFLDIMTPGEYELGTFFRMYYPTDSQCLEEYDKWPLRISEDKYISGICSFVVYRWRAWATRSEFLFYDKFSN